MRERLMLPHPHDPFPVWYVQTRMESIALLNPKRERNAIAILPPVAISLVCRGVGDDLQPAVLRQPPVYSSLKILLQCKIIINDQDICVLMAGQFLCASLSLSDTLRPPP